MIESKLDRQITSETRNKRLFYAILVINFIAVLVYNFLTPPVSDDLYWHPGKYVTLSEIMHDTWIYYTTWLGRVESYIFTRIANAYPKAIFNVINSLFFIALIISLYCNIEKKNKYDNRILALISLYIWIWGIDFAQTMLWLCGACNYLWCLAIEFGFLAFYRYRLKDEQIKYRVPQIILIFIWGLLAGAGNELSSGGVFLLALYFTFVDICRKGETADNILLKIKKNITAFEISGIMGVVSGLISMVFAPGNWVRSAVRASDEHQTGILLYLGRFIKINDIVYEYMSILIVMIVILLVYVHIYHKKSLRELKDIYAYVIVAVISIYIIIVLTIPMPRAFMGGSFIFLIACMQLIQYLDEKDTYLNLFFTSATVILFLYMSKSYVDNAANLTRIMRELDIRQEYVDEQKAKGNYSLTLPMLRKEWDNKYTFIYQDNDINEDPDSFGSNLYKLYYGLDEVVGIPWEEWESNKECQN